MKKKWHFLVILIFILSGFNTHAQQNKEKANPFIVVDVPDSVKAYIVNYYQTKENRKDITVKTGMYIFNLLNRKDFAFKNGIYSFKLMGPHFPRMIFIFNNHKTFVFNSIGAFDPSGLLEEYINCIRLLQISDKNTRKYLRAISQYLLEEEGQTYGQEIIKANSNNP